MTQWRCEHCDRRSISIRTPSRMRLRCLLCKRWMSMIIECEAGFSVRVVPEWEKD